MPSHATTLVDSGVRRAASPAGAVLAATFAVTLALFNAALNTVLSAFAGASLPTGGELPEYAVVLPIHPALAAVVALVSLLVGSFAVVVGVRILLGRSVKRWANPLECLTHRVVPATASALVAVSILAVAATVGTALFVVPGVVVAAHLLVVPVVVAVEDVGVVDAISQGWQRAAANRVQLTTAALALVVPAALLAGAVSVSYLLPPVVEFWGGVLVGAVLGLAWLGVAAESYQQLGDGSTTRRRRSDSQAL